MSTDHSFRGTKTCKFCQGSGTTAGPAGPNAYPCPFCVGYPELGTLDEYLAQKKDQNDGR